MPVPLVCGTLREVGVYSRGSRAQGSQCLGLGDSGVLCTVGHLAASLASALEMLTARPPPTTVTTTHPLGIEPLPPLV